MTELIFMLTHHDITIPNALDVLEQTRDTGLKFIGSKDIGLSDEKLFELFQNMRDLGMTTFLEVVSNDEKRHFSGVQKAMEIEADYLIGGMPQFAARTLEYLRSMKANLRFFPYVGKIVGHPCKLEGGIDDIVRQGMELARMGADGINLLLYRYSGNVEFLLNGIVKNLKKDLIVAGNVDSFEKVDQLKKSKIWAFTVGGAILERRIVPEKTIREQIIAVLNKLL